MSGLDKYKEVLSRLLRERGEKIRFAAISLFFLILVSYLSASTLAATFIGFFGESALVPIGSKRSSSSLVKGTKKTMNYRTLRKSVVGRNVFNSEGELPDEEAVGVVEEKQETAFDPNAPCAKSNLALELLGTIYMGRSSPQSLATIREKGYNIADIYRVGEEIIGQPQASVFAILPKKVEINNNGNKECLELQEPKKFASLIKGQDMGGNEEKKKEEESEETEAFSRVVLENDYVTAALGAGYAKILEAGRLVPHSRDNQMLGYKLIGVKKGSLYTKIGLKSGDVITGVNGISMTRPEQGFALYNALSEEKEIRLEVLQKGKEPTSITIEIR